MLSLAGKVVFIFLQEDVKNNVPELDTRNRKWS